MARRFINQIRDRVKSMLAKAPIGKEIKFEACEIPGTKQTTVCLSISWQFMITQDTEATLTKKMIQTSVELAHIAMRLEKGLKGKEDDKRDSSD